MSDEALKKLDTMYCDTNRAKAGHTRQVHGRFTPMERTEGGAGVQLPTAACAAATANTLHSILEPELEEHQLQVYYGGYMAMLVIAGR
jgi:hypothetical protein